ncbi:MAG: RimK family alpha-L-glutamate ligase [Bacillota bacterium]|nr:RimK family alpha-L-glutamate ligase [Bacillota bacterium]
MQEVWLVTNAYLNQNSFAKMARLFKDTAKEMNIRLIPKPNNGFIGDDSLNNHPEKALFFDKDLLLARRMEIAGMRLFNSSKAIAACDDKAKTSLILLENGIPQPKTVMAPLTYPNIGYPNLDFLHQAADILPFPMVVKETKGSFGQQVYLAHDMNELISIVTAVKTSELIFQEFIKESAGTDLRLYVVGNQVVASMKRINTRGDFRANIENGGTAVLYTPSEAEKELAVAASRVCGTDFAGVDILQSRKGPLICEVNSNAHFLGLMDLTGINPARHILGMIKETP